MSRNRRGRQALLAWMEGDRKEYPTTGKMALATIVGHRTILKAMSANEMADDRVSKNRSANAEAQAYFRKFHAEECGKRTGWVQRA